MKGDTLVIELKINNPSDWAILQPLLKRLKISFIQRFIQTETEQNSSTQEKQILNISNTTQLSNDFRVFQTSLQGDKAVVWSPYDAYDAADILLETMKTNQNSI